MKRDHIERLKHCKVIVRPGVGYDSIDIAAARERGIPVCNVPDYGTEEVPDSAIGMAIIGTIALKNGFYDQSVFCRQFQKRVGLTPRQYRTRLGKSAKWKPSPQ